MPSTTVLPKDAFYYKQRFDADTINRGAVLLECEWHGGRFESGLMLGGVFRSGEVWDGVFSGVAFVQGRWYAGEWLSGYDQRGVYRPRGDTPPHE